MDLTTNQRLTAEEVASCSLQHDIDLEGLRQDALFQNDRRWIFFWRKQNAVPFSGPAGEAEGTIHYNMQGEIRVLPASLRASATAFQGVWSEFGVVASIEHASELVRAWLLESKEVDELPPRRVQRYGI